MCDHYAPDDDFSALDYIEDMAMRIFEYQQICDEYAE